MALCEDYPCCGCGCDEVSTPPEDIWFQVAREMDEEWY